ncbi:MAG: hypothetical protein L0Y50_01570 [Beijerinckiaceae bacterium]|nr:hypothetical protein [Beijerinckiaceae bacterium]
MAVPSAAIYRLANFGATLEPGEPTEGGRMTRTIWGRLVPSTNRRVVIHTFGSDVDTVLAVYTGGAVNRLTRILGNDNRPALGLGNNPPGLSTNRSLVQFDAFAGTAYSVQMGSRSGAQGEIFASVFSFPPGGGISAFLADAGGNPFYNGRDYICEFLPCPAPKLVVHNSMSQAVTVTAASSIGSGVTPPAPFTLAAGALKVVQFAFTPAFDTTPRTDTGHFTFTAKIGAATVATAQIRAVFGRQVFPPTANIAAIVRPVVRVGYVNEPLTFTARLTNTGPQPATGCHFRSILYSYFKTVFQRVHPTTGVPLAALNEPTTIPAGQTHTFKVDIASMGEEFADPEFPGIVKAACVNTPDAPFKLANNFAITARGHAEPADVTATLVTPANGVLNVPAAGASFRVRAINRGPAAVLSVRPRYLFPFGEPASKLFTATVCETNAAGACLAPLAASVTYTATRNVIKTFLVKVLPPAVNPGFDAGLRRVFLEFKLPDFVAVGATSVAPKKI